MAAMSDYLENKLIDQLFRNTAYTFPTTMYVGLLTVAPTDSTSGTEVSGGSYARVSYACSTGNWAASTTNGTTSNSNSITFATPSGTWGTVVAFGLYDSLTTGNLLFYGSLTVNKTINSGDTVSFPATTLSIQIDN